MKKTELGLASAAERDTGTPNILDAITQDVSKFS
jgi:hypothetical protein